MSPTYKLVIFDFDGTLADSFGWLMDNMNAAAEHYGFKRLDLNQLDEVRHLSARQVMKRLELPMWKLPWVTRGMRRRMSEGIAEIRLFDGIDRLFKKLEQMGIAIAIVTSNSKANVVKVLGPENLARVKYFGCGASVFGKRPKIRQVLKVSGVAPDQVLCVGDEIRDADVATAMGLTFVGVGWGFTLADELQRHSDLPILRTPDDLLPLVTSG